MWQSKYLPPSFPSHNVFKYISFRSSCLLLWNARSDKCDPCGKSFNSEEELNSHIESDHTALPTPEKERSIASCSELQLSPIHMQRDEEKLSEQEGASAPKSPPPSLSVECDLRRGFNPYPSPWDPECGKTFTNEDDLRVHIHLAHFTCFREKYSTPCPWEGCISHEVTQ